MFCYVIYLPLYPVLCAILWVKPIGRRRSTSSRSASPMSSTGPASSSSPWPARCTGCRTGTACRFTDRFSPGWGRSSGLKSNSQGGSLPSPHAAAATVMWIMAWKHWRPAFWVLCPAILSLYLSTFYGRYHYVTDAILGIATAGLAVIAAPPLQKAWDRLAGSPGIFRALLLSKKKKRRTEEPRLDGPPSRPSSGEQVRTAQACDFSAASASAFVLCTVPSGWLGAESRSCRASKAPVLDALITLW